MMGKHMWGQCHLNIAINAAFFFSWCSHKCTMECVFTTYSEWGSAVRTASSHRMLEYNMGAWTANAFAILLRLSRRCRSMQGEGHHARVCALLFAGEFILDRSGAAARMYSKQSTNCTMANYLYIYTCICAANSQWECSANTLSRCPLRTITFMMWMRTLFIIRYIARGELNYVQAETTTTTTEKKHFLRFVCHRRWWASMCTKSVHCAVLSVCSLETATNSLDSHIFATNLNRATYTNSNAFHTSS